MTAEKIEDVLIVGAGPTGLSLAITLRRYGIPARIIDRAMQPSSVSKALAIWSASLEAMQGMNVIDDFLRDGARLNALCIGDGSRQLARMEVGEGIDSPFPFPLLIPQSETERLLNARLSALGVTVERGVELTGLSQDEDGATATLSHDNGRTEVVRARYLVGCDGARSEVRRALDIPFEVHRTSDLPARRRAYRRRRVGPQKHLSLVAPRWNRRLVSIRRGDLADIRCARERFGRGYPANAR